MILNRLKKIQKKKGERRAEEERQKKLMEKQGVNFDNVANLLEDSRDEDLLFED